MSKQILKIKNKINFPALIKGKRIWLKESQTEFGKRFGVSHAAVSDWESGKTEVEDSFDWIGLQESITITTTSGTSSYDLENSSQGIYTNQRSRVLDVYNTTTDVRLAPRPFEFIRKQNQLSTRTNQEPYAYAVSGVSAKQSLQIIFYSTPDATYSMSVECVVPQDDLTANTDYFKVPWYPVYLRGLALAIRERGEDEGELSSEVQRAYEKALGDAVAYEQSHKWQGQGGGDWIVYGDF